MLDPSVANVDLENLSVVESVNYLDNSMEINLGDRKVKLVADFDNLAKIQNVTGRGELAHIMQFSRGNFSVKDMATIIHCAIQESDKRFGKVSDVGNAILKSSKYAEYAAATAGFLTLAMSDGSEPGKPEAESQTQK